MKDFWFKIKNFLYWTLLDDKYSEILRLLNIKKANMVDTIGDHLISGTPNYTFVLSEAMSEFPGRSVGLSELCRVLDTDYFNSRLKHNPYMVQDQSLLVVKTLLTTIRTRSRYRFIGVKFNKRKLIKTLDFYKEIRLASKK